MHACDASVFWGEKEASGKDEMGYFLRLFISYHAFLLFGKNSRFSRNKRELEPAAIIIIIDSSKLDWAV